MARIKGTDRDDVLNGKAGMDTILGLGGNDTIYSGGGADTISGGDGDDLIYLRASGTVATGDAGDDRFVVETQVGSRFRTTVDGGDGFDEFDVNGDQGYSTDPNTRTDWIYSSTNNTVMLDGFTLKDFESFAGTRGQDGLYFSDVRVTYALSGGDGNDFIIGSQYVAGVVRGGSGNDTTYVTIAGTEAFGDEGDDYIQVALWNGSLASITSIDGGDGSDTLSAYYAPFIDLRQHSYVANSLFTISLTSI